MEILVLCVCLVDLICCLAVLVRPERKRTERIEPDLAKWEYEEGFRNLMNYDGSPRWKERDLE